MKISRDWFTPLALGSFALLGGTGVLMFFHLDTGLNKVAHEWLSWLLLAAVGGHAAANFQALKRHLSRGRGLAIVALCLLVLAASFLPLGKSSEAPAFAGPVQALAHAPLPVLAQVAGMGSAELQSRLQAAGVTVDENTANLASAIGEDPRRQLRVLRQVLPPAH